MHPPVGQVVVVEGGGVEAEGEMVAAVVEGGGGEEGGGRHVAALPPQVRGVLPRLCHPLCVLPLLHVCPDHLSAGNKRMALAPGLTSFNLFS